MHIILIFQQPYKISVVISPFFCWGNWGLQKATWQAYREAGSEDGLVSLHYQALTLWNRSRKRYKREQGLGGGGDKCLSARKCYRCHSYHLIWNLPTGQEHEPEQTVLWERTAWQCPVVRQSRAGVVGLCGPENLQCSVWLQFLPAAWGPSCAHRWITDDCSESHAMPPSILLSIWWAQRHTTN